MDRRHSDHCGVEGVYSHVWRAARVGGPTGEPDLLGQETVVGAASGDHRLVGVGCSVSHHRQVDIVHRAEPDELRLPTQEFDLAVAPQLVAVLDLDVLLGWDCNQRDPASERIENARGRQGGPDGQHHGDLGMMAAGVGRVGLRVSVGMSEYLERVELANHGHGGTRRPALEDALDPGERYSVLVRDSHALKGIPDQSRCLDLAETRLR